MEMGVEGGEQDVGDVERTERPFGEQRLELVAVARAPARGEEAEQERRHSRRLPEALQAHSGERLEVAELVGEHGGADRGQPVRPAAILRR